METPTPSPPTYKPTKPQPIFFLGGRYMTRKCANLSGNVEVGRLVERCKGLHLKSLVERLAPALTQLGYTEFPDKTPCMIGSHNIVTIELPDQCAGDERGAPCTRPIKFQWSVKRGVLEKGCGSYNCPCDEYAVQTGDSDEAEVTLHHIAHHNVRMRVTHPAPEHMRPTPSDFEDPMITAATEGGMKLANMLKKTQ